MTENILFKSVYAFFTNVENMLSREATLYFVKYQRG